ncbi:proteinase inhibitor I4 serpin, partial [Reticulomyxa filosa]
KISKIIDISDIDDDVRMIITNAIYFKGEFVQMFDEKLTQDNTKFFENYKREKVLRKLTMMRKEKVYEQCFVDPSIEIVFLRYRKSMLNLVLVKKKSDDDHSSLR